MQAIFDVFEPMNIASARDHADFVPGALAAIEVLRRRGLRIGSTTGYTRGIMDVIKPIAAEAGYRPEIIVCPGAPPAGRPSPLKMWYAMARMGVWPAATVVKVDDTQVGLGEGVAAGTWIVGPSLSALRAAGADLVIDSIADLPGAVDEIAARLARGERPSAG